MHRSTREEDSTCMRMRTAHLLADNPGDSALLYDIERTFIIAVPERLRRNFENWPPDPTADPELRTWLTERNLLTSSERPDWRDSTDNTSPTITDVSLDLPGACNMACHYCFEKPIHSRIGRMQEETLAAALDFAFEQATGSDHIALHFGSGEPFIAIDLLKRLVADAEARAMARRQSLSFELTTNATLVTPEIAAFLAKHPFNLRVSCDGPAEVHDRNRPMANGRASYPLVERGLKLLLEHLPDRTTVNAVLCGKTPLRAVWAWAKDLGLRHLHAIKVGSDANAPEALRASELEAFQGDLGAICDDMFAELVAGRRPIDFQLITKIVRRLMIPAPITRFCGVAGSYLGIASDGQIYPCFRHLGLKDYVFGSVFDGIDSEARLAFRNNEAADVDRRPGCSRCWARYLCGGGCYADSVVYGDDKLRPKAEHCTYWRAEISQAIRFYHRLRVTDPVYALTLFGDGLSGIVGSFGSEVPTFVKAHKTF